MDNGQKLFVGIIATLIFLNFGLRPLMHRRDAMNIAEDVLELWQEGDVPNTYRYWVDKNQSPPISRIHSYSIQETIFEKRNSVDHAKIIATIDFPDDALMPKADVWELELRDTNYGWRIIKLIPVK